MERNQREVTNSPTQSLPSLTPAIETSQQSQWFKPQKVRNTEPTNLTLSDDDSTLFDPSYSLDVPELQTVTKTNKNLTNTQHGTSHRKDLKTELKEMMLPLLPHIITLFLAKDLSQKVEAILKIAEMFKLGDTIGETLVALGISSNAETERA